MNVTLELRYCTTPQRAAAAWLIPGDDAAAWLAEIIAWNLPLADARLLHVLDAGLLVLLPAANRLAVAADKNVCPTGQAHGRLAERVYLPVEAAIDPPLADRELADLLPEDDALYVWHPRLGLLRFEPTDVMAVSDLLVPPAESGERWDAAQPGIAFNQRLLSIEPALRPTLEDLIEAARGDIGTQPLAGGQLPSHPGEPAGGAIGQAVAQAGLTAAAAAAGAVGAAASAMAAGVQSLAGMLSAGATQSSGAQPQRTSKAPAAAGSTWLERLADWARNQQQAMAGNLDRLRNRQIERLLNMLQNSPDVGLRFAIPFGGDGRHRGLARPGASLVERNVDFSLSGVGGGGAVDFWNLPDGYRRKLVEQYRSLANREISLGRHRRAAYIFAKLLGDLTTAAATLAAGGHYREAAVLYEQRLKQPQAAARCLEQGGLWAEAIALYEQLLQWEKVAELYEKLDRPEEAATAIRKAVMFKLEARDFLGAANLMEHKLHEPEEALQTLVGAWPDDGQALACLDASFQLLGRHGWHDKARQQIVSLAPAARGTSIFRLVEVLAKVAHQYPAEEVRGVAAESTRVLVAERLPFAQAAEMRHLLGSFASLVPQDKLLSRDCDRYQAQRFESADRQRLQTGSRQKPRPVVRIVSTFRLPPGTWKTAIGIGEHYYAGGWLDNHLVLVRGNWNGAMQRLTPMSRATHHQQAQPILLAADPRGLEPLYVFVAPGVPDSLACFAETDQFARALAVTHHSGASEHTRVLAYGPGHTVLVGRFEGEGGADVSLVLTPYDNQRPLPGVQAVQFELQDLPDLDYILRQPLPFYCRAADYYLGIGPRLIHKRLRQTVCAVPSPILSITGSALHSRPRIVLGCEQGGAILWGDTADAPHTTFASELAEPSVGLNRGGWLIAATTDNVEVFSTFGGKLHFAATAPGPQDQPLAVLSTPENHRFALITQGGQVLIYEIPPRLA